MGELEKTAAPASLAHKLLSQFYMPEAAGKAMAGAGVTALLTNDATALPYVLFRRADE